MIHRNLQGMARCIIRATEPMGIVGVKVGCLALRKWLRERDRSWICNYYAVFNVVMNLLIAWIKIQMFNCPYTSGYQVFLPEPNAKTRGSSYVLGRVLALIWVERLFGKMQPTEEFMPPQSVWDNFWTAQPMWPSWESLLLQRVWISLGWV